MSDQPKRFPLTLSSVVDKKARSSAKPVSSISPKPLYASQTAVKNVAQRVATMPQVPTASSKPESWRSNNTHSSSALLRNLIPVNSDLAHSPRPPSDAVRRAMVARVAKQGVSDTTVLAAMEAVPRHMFMDSALASQAYVDASLPIGHHQTISQPYIVARMIEIMRANKWGGEMGKVLEIGTGCGYQAAVLSQVAKEVYSIERIKPLHELAKQNLRPLRIANIRLHYGDGMLGLPQVAPFDGIILAAAGLTVPQALLEQLRVGGRLVAPVGGAQQELQLIERVSASQWKTSTLEKCHFVPLKPGTLSGA
jgi:protein-L-isoaspartate(D-aspartate) O-methyltransferase